MTQSIQRPIDTRCDPRQAPDSRASADIVIAFSTDGNYVRHTGTTIASLLLNSSETRCIELVILDGGISDTDRLHLMSLEELHPRCSIQLLDFAHLFQELPARNDYYSRANYFRLLLPSTLHRYDRVLYLDSDIVVLNDLGALFDTDLGAHHIAACEDMGIKAIIDYNLPPHSAFGAMPFRKYFGEYLGIRRENHERYFNSGVLLMDLNKLRNNGYEMKFVTFLNQHQGRFFLADQDILNHFFQDDYRSLDLSWNMQLYDLDWAERLPDDVKHKLRSAFDAPRVIHFTGPENKPWLSPDAAYADVYWKYFRETPWCEDL